MITGSENEELLLVLIPISAKPTKNSGAVIQRVREDAEFHFGIRNDATVVTYKIWQWHGIHLTRSVYHTDRLGGRSTLDLDRE